MNKSRKFEFFLLRYVPHVVRGRYVDFGVMLIEKGVEGGYTGVRFLPNWREIQDLDPQADVEVLEAFIRELKGQWGIVQDPVVMTSWLEDSHSNLIQLSPPQVCLADDPVEQMEFLVRTYLSDMVVARASGPAERPEAGRRLILNRMQEEFERAGVWRLLMRGISVGQYTKTDDAFKFDFGYLVGGGLKMFHAVSMKSSLNPALDMAAKYRKLSTQLAENVTGSFFLTAVIEDDVDRTDERVAYVMSGMTHDGIDFAGLGEMPEIANQAKAELKA